MSTLDTKIASLRERWEEIQKKKLIKNAREAVKSLRNTDVKPKTPAEGSNLRSMSAGRDPVKNAMDQYKENYNKLTDDQRNNVDDLQKRQHDLDIGDLLEPIQWFGPIAVGASKRFAGWWMVVPPFGFTISYMGPEGYDNAIAQAKIIRPYYE